jgi:hypothetical protein
VSVPLGKGSKLTAGSVLALAVGEARPNVAPADGTVDGDGDGLPSTLGETDGGALGRGGGSRVSSKPLAAKMAPATSKVSSTLAIAPSGLTVRGCR